jgi:Vam6/Vps39-like protein vacuolar protein sorting-associated protein 39
MNSRRYCKRVYQPTGETRNVFLTLLRIYLQPTQKTTTDLLQPALDLISRHGPRLDAAETLQLIPPLVTTQAIRRFLLDTLHTPVFDTCVIRDISNARNDQLARKLVALQSKRVRVTDSRMYEPRFVV